MAELFSYHEDSNDNFFYNIKIDLFYLIFNDLPPTNCSCRKNSLKQYIYFTISLINYNQLGQFCCYQVKESLLCGHAQSLASLQRRPTAKRQDFRAKITMLSNDEGQVPISQLAGCRETISDRTFVAKTSVYILTLNEDPKL